MTGNFKFGHKEYPNIHMEVIPSVRVWRRKHHRFCLNSRSIMAHCKVDATFISLIDEPLAQFPHAFVCFIRGISLDAFESRWMIPIVGWKDVVRCSEQCHIWWMDGLWPEFYTVIWESAVDMDVIWRPSVGSSLRGWPHGVSVLSFDSLDVIQGIRSWLWSNLYTLGRFVRRVCLGCNSLHHGNNPAAFRRLATQPSR